MEPGFDYLAVFAAAIAAMLLGGIWYSPLLFEKRWRALIASADESRSRSPGVIYGVAFLLLLVSAAVFHAFLGPDPEFGFAVGVGLSAGIAWSAGTIWINYLFEGRAFGLFLINGGYHMLQFTIFGLVFGLM